MVIVSVTISSCWLSFHGEHDKCTVVIRFGFKLNCITQ